MKMKDFLKTVGMGSFDLWLQDAEIKQIAICINDDQLKQLIREEGYGDYTVKLLYPTKHFKQSGYEIVEIPAISITISKTISKGGKKDMYNKKVSGYRVIEDNGGGLALVVMDKNGMVFYHHTGYEHHEGSLRADIEALENGDDPAEWDGNELETPVEFGDLYDYELFRGWDGYNVIIEDDVIAWGKMGSAGKREFKNWRCDK